MRITSRLHSHSLWTRIVQALESSAIQIISNVHLHVRARPAISPATLDGLWRRAVGTMSAVLVAAEGGVVAAVRRLSCGPPGRAIGRRRCLEG